MSTEEREFIRKLRITLISTLGPLIISGLILTGVNLHRISTNEAKIDAINQDKVSKEVLLLYVNELREMSSLLRHDMNDKGVRAEQQIQEVEDRLDKLMADVYEVKKRGVIN